MGVNNMTIRQRFFRKNPVLNCVIRKSRFFGKHGERYDRRLFALVEANRSLYIEFCNDGLLVRDAEEFRQIMIIHDSMMKKGQEMYYDFP